MSLKMIVSLLGGELYDGGRRACIPAPGHSARDRSVSLVLIDGRVIVHGFGAVGWREVLEDLRARGLIDAAGRLAESSDARGGYERLDRASAVARLWEGSQTIQPWTPAARYLARRHVRARQACDLRFHPAAYVRAYAMTGPTRPALLAGVRDPAGALTAVELTYLTRHGERDVGLRLPRKTVGRLPAGSAVRLGPPEAALLVAEGVFSALSAGERFGLPAWALLSVTNLARWIPPAGTVEVVIAADRDAPGAAAAASLADRLERLGVAASIQRPPEPFGDWNDVAAQAGGGRDGEGGPDRPGNGPCAGGPENDP